MNDSRPVQQKTRLCSSQVGALLMAIAVCFALISAANAQLEDCVEVPASVVAPGLGAIPAWDQQDTLVCYAFSAAVLVDLYRQSHGELKTGRFSAPLAVTAQAVLDSVDNSSPSSFYGGQVVAALRAVRRVGSCDATWVRDGIGAVGISQVLGHLREFKTKAASANEVRAYLASLGGEGMPLPDTSKTAAALLLAPDLYLATLISSLCEPVMRGPLPEPQFATKPVLWTDPPLASKLDELLVQKHTPVAVEFCAESVTLPQFYPNYDGICNRHNAVVVAQRFQSGRCEVLLRDSQCSQYKFPLGQSSCSSDGLHWMDRRHLLSNSYGLSWL